MEAYISITMLIIAILLKRNYELSRKLKRKHKSSYIAELQKRNDETYLANQKLAIELRRQMNINYTMVSQYNELRDSIIDMPPKSGRFFAVKLTNNAYLKHFSEN